MPIGKKNKLNIRNVVSQQQASNIARRQVHYTNVRKIQILNQLCYPERNTEDPDPVLDYHCANIMIKTDRDGY